MTSNTISEWCRTADREARGSAEGCAPAASFIKDLATPRLSEARWKNRGCLRLRINTKESYTREQKGSRRRPRDCGNTNEANRHISLTDNGPNYARLPTAARCAAS